MRAGFPSMPFADVPYVATSNVSLVFFEWLKFHDPETVLLGDAATSNFASRAMVSTGCSMGRLSSMPSLVFMKLRSDVR